MQMQILKTLRASERPLSIGTLEEKLGKNRLTIYYNLKRLRERGFVRQDRTDRIYTWNLEPLETASGATEIPIEHAYDEIARSSSRKLWGIQGAGAIRALVEGISKGTTYRSIHHRQRLRQVIVDAILTTKGVGLIKNIPPAELSSHLRRPTILHVTADVPELNNLEIISDGRLLLVVNRVHRIASILRDQHAIAAYLALHETIKALSTKMRPKEMYGDFE